MNTSSYGPGGDGAEIAYAIVDSALGRLLVAGTERGICFAAMGEADRTLVAELVGDYPRATIRVADPNRREGIVAVQRGDQRGICFAHRGEADPAARACHEQAAERRIDDRVSDFCAITARSIGRSS